MIFGETGQGAGSQIVSPSDRLMSSYFIHNYANSVHQTLSIIAQINSQNALLLIANNFNCNLKTYLS